MRFPDFSAEASLYRTINCYHFSASGRGYCAGNQVVPNLIYRTWCTPCSITGTQHCCTSAPRNPPCWPQSCCPPPSPYCSQSKFNTCPHGVTCTMDPMTYSWDSNHICCLHTCWDQSGIPCHVATSKCDCP